MGVASLLRPGDVRDGGFKDAATSRHEAQLIRAAALLALVLAAGWIGNGGTSDGLVEFRGRDVGNDSDVLLGTQLGGLAQRPALQAAPPERAEVPAVQQEDGSINLEPLPRLLGDDVLSWLEAAPLASPADTIREVLEDRGWTKGEIDFAVCVNEHEDRTGIAVHHEDDGTHSYGAYQLNTAGKLLSFYARGYHDPMDVRQQANWIAAEFADWAGTRWGFWSPWFNARAACL